MGADLPLEPGVQQLLASFFVGFLSALTPCVYPLIPVTVALFAREQQSSKLTSLKSASIYVLGIASTYTLLGVLSARAGILFGSFLGNPLVIVTLALVLFYLALVTVDLARLPFIHSVQNKAAKAEPRGYKGLFVAGSLSGVIAAPCIGPTLAVILGIAAASGNSLYAAALLFSYALGFGVIFLFLGTFSGALNLIPRSGTWLLHVKALLALAVLLVMWFVLGPVVPAIPRIPSDLLWAVAVLAGIALYFYSSKTRIKLLPFLVCLALSFGIYVQHIALPPAPAAGTPTATVNWGTSLKEAYKNSKSILVVDLTAEWCAACHELERYTFSDPAVQLELQKFTAVRLDFTEEGPFQQEFATRYNVPGLPCILFLRPDGSEIPNTRITGFIDARSFVKHLQMVRHTAGDLTPTLISF